MNATSIDLSQIKTDALSAASTFRTLIGLGTSDTPTFKAATLSAGTLNGTVLDISQTWGGTGTYTGIKYNVTDSGPANAASLLMDLQVGGSSRFKVSKIADITIGGTGNGYVHTYDSGANYFLIKSAGSASTVAFNGSASNGPGLNIGRDLAYSWSSSTSGTLLNNADLSLWRDAANTLAQRKTFDTVHYAQAYRLYNKYSDVNNWERAVLDWQTTADVLRIGTEAGGSGTVRNIALVGGNVGIGTTSPGAKLSVSGGDILLDNNRYLVALRNVTGQQHQIFSLDNNNDIVINRGAGYYGGSYPADIIAVIGQNDAIKFVDSTPGVNTLFSFLHNGSFGIGVTPAAKLDILDTTGAGSGSLQASALNIAQTWNTTGTPTAIKLNVTDTASNAASLLMDLQVGGSSRARFDKNGSLTISGPRESGNLISATTTGYSGFSVNYAASVTCGNISASNITWSGNNGGDASYVYTPTLALRGSGSAYITDCLLTRDAANTLAQRNGTSAQALRLYKTWANNGVDYERGVLDWQTTSDVLRIGTEAGGTGTVRNIALVGGNVGIGTTAPTSKLHLSGTSHQTNPADIVAKHTSGNSPGIALYTGSIYANFYYNQGDRATYLQSVGDAQADFILRNYDSGASFVLKSSGSVGIGLTSPAAKLDILDTTGAGSGSLQASALNIAQTWNTTGTPTAFKLNVTDTASNAASLFAAFQFAGVSRYEFAKTAFRLYNTNDASTANYERAKIAWESNVLKIGTEGLGTGAVTPRAMEFQTAGTTRLTIGTDGKCVLNVPVTAGSENQFKIDDGSTGGYFAIFEGASGASVYLPSFVGRSAGINGAGLCLRGAIPSANDVSVAGLASVLIECAKDTSGSLSQLANANLLCVSNFGTAYLTISAGKVITLADASNLAVGTTTGTKIGTATNQKLGFYNATPVVQPAAVADATDAASVITQLNLILARMRDLGLIAT